MNIDVTTIIVAIIGSGVLNTLLTHLLTVKSKKKIDSDETRATLRLLMKDRLRFLCTFYINQGWIYADELDDIVDMHKCYHDTLKGNGYLDELMRRVKKLEIRGVGVK